MQQQAINPKTYIDDSNDKWIYVVDNNDGTIIASFWKSYNGLERALDLSVKMNGGAK